MTIEGNGLATAQLENLATYKEISRGNGNILFWVTAMLILKYGVEE